MTFIKHIFSYNLPGLQFVTVSYSIKLLVNPIIINDCLYIIRSPNSKFVS